MPDSDFVRLCFGARGNGDIGKFVGAYSSSLCSGCGNGGISTYSKTPLYCMPSDQLFVVGYVRQWAQGPIKVDFFVWIPSSTFIFFLSTASAIFMNSS